MGAHFSTCGRYHAKSYLQKYRLAKYLPDSSSEGV
ncbi:hypothetical protein Lser_V15G32895 [Lactuca serriola]